MSKNIGTAFVSIDEDTLDTVAGGIGAVGVVQGCVSILDGLNVGGILNGSANGTSAGNGNTVSVPVLGSLLNGLGLGIG